MLSTGLPVVLVGSRPVELPRFVIATASKLSARRRWSHVVGRPRLPYFASTKSANSISPQAAFASSATASRTPGCDPSCASDCVHALRSYDLLGTQPLPARSAGRDDRATQRPRNPVVLRREVCDPGTTLCVELPTRLSCQQKRAHPERDQKERHEYPDCLQGRKSSHWAPIPRSRGAELLRRRVVRFRWRGGSHAGRRTRSGCGRFLRLCVCDQRFVSTGSASSSELRSGGRSPSSAGHSPWRGSRSAVWCRATHQTSSAS